MISDGFQIKTRQIGFLNPLVTMNSCSSARQSDVLVVSEIKGSGVSLKPVVIGFDSAHEEAHGLSGVASAPFLASLF